MIFWNRFCLKLLVGYYCHALEPKYILEPWWLFTLLTWAGSIQFYLGAGFLPMPSYFSSLLTRLNGAVKFSKFDPLSTWSVRRKQEAEGGRGIFRSVDPILTKGEVDYARQITTYPLDFQTFRRPARQRIWTRDSLRYLLPRYFIFSLYFLDNRLSFDVMSLIVEIILTLNNQIPFFRSCLQKPYW